MRTTKQKYSRHTQRGRGRKRPGLGGAGQFYRIEVRPKSDFVMFRTQDVGERGHLQRIAGKRPSGTWGTHTWLIEKQDAHVTDIGTLVIHNPKVKSVLKQIRGKINHKKGSIFKAFSRRNVPEKEKPTKAQRAAQKRNMNKALATRTIHNRL